MEGYYKGRNEKEEEEKKNTHTNANATNPARGYGVTHKCPAPNRAARQDVCSCLMCVQYVCEKREKHRERLQIRKSVLRLGSIWPGSPGQLGYNVMEKIAIFSSGSLTYLSLLTDIPPPFTPTYTLLPPTLCPSVSLFIPRFPSHVQLLLTPELWASTSLYSTSISTYPRVSACVCAFIHSCGVVYL